MSGDDIEATPGWPEVVGAIRAAGLHRVMDGMKLARLTVNILSAVRPVIQAEMLANLSDEFAEEYPELAHALDEAAHEIRETITR